MGSRCGEDVEIFVIKPDGVDTDAVGVENIEIVKMFHRATACRVNDHVLFIPALCKMDEEADSIVIG